MKKIFSLGAAAVILSSAISCKTDFDTDVTSVQVTAGQANFSKYVALGNSLTSGYRDNALYVDGQIESYPNLLATQMKMAGGGEFKQPLWSNNTGGIATLLGPNSGKLTLQLVNGSLAPVASAAGQQNIDIIANAGPYQNMGIPGAKSFHLGLDNYGTLNPYYARFSTGVSPIKAAVAQNPTFFSLWIGNNDVLAYATSGGTNVKVVNGVPTVVPAVNQAGNNDPATYGFNDITSPTVVAASITGYVNALTANGAKGVIANIPSVTSVPFFTTVPVNPLTSALIGKGDATAGAAAINQLNTGVYGPLKNVLTALGAGDRINLLSSTAANPVLIKDKDLTDLSAQITAALTPSVGVATATAFGQIYGQARQAKTGDYVLLSTRSVIGTPAAGAPASINVYGISYPLENQHILTAAEAALVATATTAYNSAIKSIADSKGLAFVDANAKMVDLGNGSGIMWDGVRYNATFVSGGAFSLDGIHLTGRGYAIIANEFIKAINGKYGATLPQVSPNKYSGVTFP